MLATFDGGAMYNVCMPRKEMEEDGIRKRDSLRLHCWWPENEVVVNVKTVFTSRDSAAAPVPLTTETS